MERIAILAALALALVLVLVVGVDGAVQAGLATSLEALSASPPVAALRLTRVP
jgi:hypothetical protein